MVGYWNATKESGESIMKKYLSALDDQVAIIYKKQWNKMLGHGPIQQKR